MPTGVSTYETCVKKLKQQTEYELRKLLLHVHSISSTLNNPRPQSLMDLQVSGIDL